jgi:hypothetical protein
MFQIGFHSSSVSIVIIQVKESFSEMQKLFQERSPANMPYTCSHFQVLVLDIYNVFKL